MSAGHATQNQSGKSIVYYQQDNNLEIKLPDKAVVRETSQGWNTIISYAEDGTIMEIVLLEAKNEGRMPMELRQAA